MWGKYWSKQNQRDNESLWCSIDVQEHWRGSELLCKGIGDVISVSLLALALVRKKNLFLYHWISISSHLMRSTKTLKKKLALHWNLLFLKWMPKTKYLGTIFILEENKLFQWELDQSLKFLLNLISYAPSFLFLVLKIWDVSGKYDLLLSSQDSLVRLHKYFTISTFQFYNFNSRPHKTIVWAPPRSLAGQSVWRK